MTQPTLHYWYEFASPYSYLSAVRIGDVAKGSAAIVIAQLLDVPGLLVLLVGGAALFGHWKPLFAGFRGGDGMASLM
ncbi:MAG: glycerol-3-phosphate acyltransferase, partial [Proteobacteria bacterium]|nr:glycerol-3-phosphate acyltransferase [Pseudomonadota bacterium]